MVYHRYLIGRGNFYTAEVVFNLLKYGEVSLGTSFDKVKIIRLLFFMDIENPYEIILIIDNKLIIAKGEKTGTSEECEN